MSMKLKLLTTSALAFGMAALSGCDNSWKYVTAPPVVAEGCGSVGDGKSFVGFTAAQQATMIGYDNQLLAYQKANNLTQTCIFDPSALPANSVNDVVNGKLNQFYITVDSLGEENLVNGVLQFSTVNYGLSEYVRVPDPLKTDGSSALFRHGIATSAINYSNSGYGPLISFNQGDAYGDTQYITPNINFLNGYEDFAAPANTSDFQLETDMVTAENQGNKVYNQYPSINLNSYMNNFVEYLKNSYGIVPNPSDPNSIYDPTDVETNGATLANIMSFVVPGKQFIQMTAGIIMREDDNKNATNSIVGVLFMNQFGVPHQSIPETLSAVAITIDQNGNVTYGQAGAQAMAWVNKINSYQKNQSFYAENHNPAHIFPQLGKHKGNVELAQLLLPAPKAIKGLLPAQASGGPVPQN